MTYRCEAPDCDVWVTSAARSAPVAGWLVVRERDGDGEVRELDVCSWNCLLLLAGATPVPETVTVNVR